MGRLSRQPISAWRREYGLISYVETGLAEGDGFLHAIKNGGFLHHIGIEVHPEVLGRVAARLEAAEVPEHRWDLVLGDSLEAVAQLLRTQHLPPTMWWLDAHLPENYGTTPAARLPLLHEVEAIITSPRCSDGDVFIMDDWRLYEDLDYGAGRLPDRWRLEGGRLPGLQHRDRLLRLFTHTHRLRIDLRDEGYLIALPIERSGLAAIDGK